MTLFEERERAAEYGFTHEEELRFLATRDGIEALALWFAERVPLDAPARDVYVQDAVSRFVSGEDERTLIASVRADLERLGKADVAGEADIIFAKEVARSSDRLHGRFKSPEAGSAARDANSTHHQNAFWGWTV